MIVILAVAPSWMASKIHLYAEGYLPGRKARESRYRLPLCGAQRIGDDAVMVPIAQALAELWTNRRPGPQDPRPQWSWCRNCIGHALDLAGLTRVALDHLAQAATPTKEINS